MFAQSNIRPVDEVNPFIGSVSCRWFFFTPGALPFGMARLGPHTNAHYGSPSGWEPIGYDYREKSIEGFGQFHEFQIGGIVLMPLTGALRTVPGDTVWPYKGYRSAFDKSSEKAMPGYYSVFLKDHGVKAELTATRHVGFQRFTFPQGKPSYILIDVGNSQGESGKVLDARVTRTSDREIEGYVVTLPEYVRQWDSGGSVRMYFVARFSSPVLHYGSFNGSDVHAGSAEGLGKGCGMYVSFDTRRAHTETVKVGLSYISTTNARQNLEQEAADLPFDQAKAQAIDTWNKALSRISVSGGKKEDREKLYTGLYHALSGRGIASDVNGQYPKIGGGVGQIPLDAAGKPAYAHYNSDATWGAFWNLLPLWGLVYPEVLNDYVRSSLDVYKDFGWLPDGVASGALTPGMPSNFMGLFVASAYNRGIRNFDVDLAWAAARKNELDFHNRPLSVGKYDLEDFITRGYIPIEHTFQGYKFSGSHTLEYSFSSWAVGQMALALGKQEDYAELNRMGLSYRALFDPAYRMVRARDSSGAFVKDFTLNQVWNGFQEGNSWQYSWYVPQDVQGLINIMGRREFNDRLDSIFTQSEKMYFGGGKEVNDFAGLEAIYNQGNQPCLHIPWLFNYSGKPWLTEKWLRRIMDVFYGTGPIHGYGYGQDEDQGQLGAWYVLSSIGLFDVEGGASLHPTMQLSSSQFDSVTISLNRAYFPGKRLVIVAHNNAPGHVYIHHPVFNGEPLHTPWIPFGSLVKGGTLEYTLGPAPDTLWGSKPSDAPPANYPDTGRLTGLAHSLATGDFDFRRMVKEVYDTIEHLYALPGTDLFRENVPAQKGDPKAAYFWSQTGMFTGAVLMKELGFADPAYDRCLKGFELFWDTTRLPVGYQSSPVQYGPNDRFYDDNATAGIDLVEAYRVTGRKAYLDKAKACLAFDVSGESPARGGGLFWNEVVRDSLQSPDCIKATNATAFAVTLALQLYQITHRRSYLDFATRLYRWNKSYMQDSTDGIYWNDVSVRTGKVNKTKWTYNVGQVIVNDCLFYRITGKDAWLKDAQRLAKASCRFFTHPGEDGIRFFPPDNPWFTAILFRGYLDLYALDKDPVYVNDVIQNASYAWEHARKPDGTFLEDWEGKVPGRYYWILNQAAVLEIYARIALLKHQNQLAYE